MWVADGKSLYYVSEFHGTPANIVRLPSTPTGTPAADGAPSRSRSPSTRTTASAAPASARNGDWIVYECGADLWVVSHARTATPRKLAIEVNADDKTNPEQHRRPSPAGATEFALSPRREARRLRRPRRAVPACRSAPAARPTRLTDTPGQRPRHRLVARRHEDHLPLRPRRPRGPLPAGARRPRPSRARPRPTSFKVDAADQHAARRRSASASRPTASASPSSAPASSWTMNPDGTRCRRSSSTTAQVFDYEWSPDSQVARLRPAGRLVRQRAVHRPRRRADRGQPGPQRHPLRHLQRRRHLEHGRQEARLPQRAPRQHGNLLRAVAAEAGRPGRPSDAVEPTDIDWDDIHLRVSAAGRDAGRRRRPSRPTAARSPSATPGQRRPVGRQHRRQPADAPDHRRPCGPRRSSGRAQALLGTLDLIYFRDGSGSIRHGHAPQRLRPATPPAIVPFQVKMTVRTRRRVRRDVRPELALPARATSTTPSFHGANWDAVREQVSAAGQARRHEGRPVRPALPDAGRAERLAPGHHAASPSAPEETTADLGLIFDEAYRGQGLKIAEMLKRGPADQRGLNLKPGDVILAIDGVELDRRRPT